MYLPPWPKIGEQQKINYSLKNIKAFLKVLKNPQNTLQNVIHIAGTNGKGSTLAFLNAILEEAGYSVNCYTSPHLIAFNERIVIKGQQITNEQINSYSEFLSKKAKNLPITFFEGVTAMAFLAFAQNNADFNLIETGCGGRLDATNAMQKKLASIITSISFDHMDLLGSSIKKIATQKAGILKKNTLAVISKQEYEDAKNTLLNKITQKQALGFIYGKDFEVKNSNYLSKNLNISLKNLGLLGKHQQYNASNSIATIDALNIGISEKNILLGLKKTFWPARMQKLKENIYLDGCHNEDGAKTLAENVSSWKNLNLIISIKKGKDASGIISQLSILKNANFHFVPMQSMEFEPLDTLITLTQPYKLKAFKSISFEEALSKTKSSDNVVICGSLYFAGEVLNKFH